MPKKYEYKHDIFAWHDKGPKAFKTALNKLSTSELWIIVKEHAYRTISKKATKAELIQFIMDRTDRRANQGSVFLHPTKEQTERMAAHSA